MNLSEFLALHEHVALRQKVTVLCSTADCGREETLNKESAIRNIKSHNDQFVCRSCCYTEEGKQKISEATSYKRSEATRKQMSESANKKWQTDWGKKQKKVLAEKAIEQNRRTNLDKSKRKVLYISAKNEGEVRVCFSSGEFVACEDILEKDDTIAYYDMQVGYEINGQSRSLDFLIRYTDGRTKVVEVKPAKRMTEDFHKQQIADSSEYAQSMDWEFELWTEAELGITNWKEARDRADEYRKTHYLLDYASYRLQKNRVKAKRHYDSKVAEDKVVVFCSFCNEYHVRLRVAYDRVVKKRGRFICIKENGSLIGSRPKKKKESPHGPEHKRCSGPCDRVLPLDNFSKGKAKCKECRANQYKAKYHEAKNTQT